MEAGPVVTKADMKLHQWIAQYENWNVDIGLETGFKGRAQIGKGMWPMPDEMLGMYNTKTMHPKAGIIVLGYHLQPLQHFCNSLSSNSCKRRASKNHE